MKINYLCKSWQFFLQQLVYLVGKGYYYYCITTIPIEKEDKVKSIDNKIISKYDIDKSKYQRARQKKAKEANFYYLRYKNILVILHTEGEIVENLDDIFFDIRNTKKLKERLKISVSSNLEFVVSVQQAKDKINITISLTNSVFKELKTELEELVKRKKIKDIELFFNKINNIPAWGGVIKQRKLLLEEMYNFAKKYGLNKKGKDGKGYNNILKYPCEFKDLREFPYLNCTKRKIYNSEHINQELLGSRWI